MIRFVGDICLADNDFDKGFGVGSQICQGLIPFKRIPRKENEIWVGNMECALSESSQRTKSNKDCFRANPVVLASDSLIDCYSVANNHILEHGNAAYKETIDTIHRYNKVTVGSKDEKTIILTDGSKKVAITSFSLRCDNTEYDADYWYAPELEELRLECERYSDADYRVAYIHWGVEFMPYPYQDQQKLAHYLVDIGYSLVIGMHPHVLQGYEVYKGRSIFYSIGNFVFNMAYQDTHFGLVVSLNPLTGVVSYDYIKIGADYCPSLINSTEVPEHLKLEYLNSLMGSHPNVEQYSRVFYEYLKKYRKSHHLSIFRNIFKYDFTYLKEMILGYFHGRLQ